MRILAAVIAALLLGLAGGVVGYAIHGRTEAARRVAVTTTRHAHRRAALDADAFGLVRLPTVRCPTKAAFRQPSVPLSATTRVPIPPVDVAKLAAYTDRDGNTNRGPAWVALSVQHRC